MSNQTTNELVDELQQKLQVERERNNQLEFKLRTLLVSLAKGDDDAELFDLFKIKALQILDISEQQQKSIQATEYYEQIIWWLSKRLSKVLNGKAEYLYKKALSHNKEVYLKKSKSFQLEMTKLNTKLERKMMKVLQSSIDLLTTQQIEELIDFVDYCKTLTKQQVKYKIKKYEV